jgi:hypothetical protein
MWMDLPFIFLLKFSCYLFCQLGALGQIWYGQAFCVVLYACIHPPKFSWNLFWWVWTKAIAFNVCECGCFWTCCKMSWIITKKITTLLKFKSGEHLETDVKYYYTRLHCPFFSFKPLKLVLSGQYFGVCKLIYSHVIRNLSQSYFLFYSPLFRVYLLFSSG